MKIILYIVAILAAGGAAFFSINHTGKFKKAQQARLETIAERKQIASEAETTEKQLKDLKSALVVAGTKKEEVIQKLDAIKAAGATVERDIGGLEATLQTQDEDFAELNKAKEELGRIMSGLGDDVTIETLGDKIKEFGENKKAQETKLEELETLTTAAEKLLATNRAELDRQMKRDIERTSRQGRGAMESVVSAVNQDWGFLVIAAGSNSGFTPQTPLIVERDGKAIGRVRPSSVEPTQTIAEIDLNTLATGVRLQPGDRVITAKPSSN
jgi:hypothetical protein